MNELRTSSRCSHSRTAVAVKDVIGRRCSRNRSASISRTVSWFCLRWIRMARHCLVYSSITVNMRNAASIVAVPGPGRPAAPKQSASVARGKLAVGVVLGGQVSAGSHLPGHPLSFRPRRNAGACSDSGLRLQQLGYGGRVLAGRGLHIPGQNRL